MKKTNVLLILCFAALSYLTSFGQDKFNTCSAIFVEDNRLVDEYSPRGKCKVDNKASGTITVREIIGDEDYKKDVKVPFRVAIKEGKTNTMVMFSEQRYEELALADVLKKCNKGDHIVVMTEGDKWSLPHHEILVE